MENNNVRKNSSFKQYFFLQLINNKEENIDYEFGNGKMTQEELIQKKLDFKRESLPYMEHLFSYALKISKDFNDACNLIQATYIRAFLFFHKYDKKTDCKAWLLKIMKNCFINNYRSPKKEFAKTDNEDVQDFYDFLKEGTTSTNSKEFEIYSHLFYEEIRATLLSLPDDFKYVIILCDLEGLRCEETAEYFECPVETVRSRLQEGRKLFQNKISQYVPSHKEYI